MTEQPVEYRPDAGKHVCALPGDDSARPDGTLARCWECRTWWFWGTVPGSELAWGYEAWRQVRWYHVFLRARISQLIEEGKA